MPQGWVDPERITSYKGVCVYHTYKDDEIDNRTTFGYTTDINYVEGFEDSDKYFFDVRDLPRDEEINVNDPETHLKIIMDAIDKKLLVLPKGMKYAEDREMDRVRGGC